jgi:hypothetical protein
MSITARIQQPGTIGKVVVRPTIRTTIADQKYKPELQVSIYDLTDIDLITKQQGDVILYDSATNRYKSAPLGDAEIKVPLIFGGYF